MAAHQAPVSRKIEASMAEGIRASVANARPDLKAEQNDLLTWLLAAVDSGDSEKVMSLLERLDIWDHYPPLRRPDGTFEAQPMPGGWTSWHGWMLALKQWEAAPGAAAATIVATPDIAGT